MSTRGVGLAAQAGNRTTEESERWVPKVGRMHKYSNNNTAPTMRGPSLQGMQFCCLIRYGAESYMFSLY